MAQNKLSNLRDLMFEGIELLLDKDSGFDVEKAEAMANLGNVIVNSAKVEYQIIKTLGLEKEDMPKFFELGDGNSKK